MFKVDISQKLWYSYLKQRENELHEIWMETLEDESIKHYKSKLKKYNSMWSIFRRLYKKPPKIEESRQYFRDSIYLPISSYIPMKTKTYICKENWSYSVKMRLKYENIINVDSEEMFTLLVNFHSLEYHILVNHNYKVTITE